MITYTESKGNNNNENPTDLGLFACVFTLQTYGKLSVWVLSANFCLYEYLLFSSLYQKSYPFFCLAARVWLL